MKKTFVLVISVLSLWAGAIFGLKLYVEYSPITDNCYEWALDDPFYEGLKMYVVNEKTSKDGVSYVQYTYGIHGFTKYSRRADMFYQFHRKCTEH